jgi:hypothetical protein
MLFLAGGGGGTEVRAGVGGGPEELREPAKGGGTPNLDEGSSAGVFVGTRGGGGGATEDEALDLAGGWGTLAYFPASAMGGGARNMGRGGEGARGGEGEGDGGLAGAAPLLGCGGAGGGPRLELVPLPPVV